MNSHSMLKPSFPLPSSTSATPASHFSNFRYALSVSRGQKLMWKDEQWNNRHKKPSNCIRPLTVAKERAHAATQTDSLCTMFDVVEKTEPANIFETVSKPKKQLANMWREIQGGNNWEGLLDPMDDILRKEIIRYGEFAQACYDGFDFDPFSTIAANIITGSSSLRSDQISVCHFCQGYFKDPAYRSCGALTLILTKEDAMPLCQRTGDGVGVGVGVGVCKESMEE